MKKTISLAFIAIFMLSVVSLGCAKAQTPGNVVKEFYSDIKAGNTSAAAKMFSEKDIKALKDAGSDMESAMKDLASNFKNAGFEKFEVASEQVSGDKAVVEGNVFVKGASQPVEISLIKEKGAWKLTQQ